ncbi:MAG: patatin-like phospholipase family protein [Actinobacteria bacterium]|nr:patatin-like phospholipase family protein [Actinomycetota bacterium]
MVGAVPNDVMSPVHDPSHDDRPGQGLALCLSGGGYRAMVFHVGVLWRLNEVGLLPELDHVSAVSGGSITAGALALCWSNLKWENNSAVNFGEELVEPILRMSGSTVDVTAVLGGVLSFGDSVADRVAAAYRRHLFGDATLQDLPDAPRFVFNATNLESGALMRFAKKYLGDHTVGRVMRPDLELAVAVAASSAFPPVLSPCTLDLRDRTWVTDTGNTLVTPGFRGVIRLTDGGVYDNLGLETAWKNYTSIIVSDAGGRLAPDDEPATDPLRQTARVLKIVDSQVRALRKRQVIESFIAGARSGMYVGIRSDTARFDDAVLSADPKRTAPLAALPTRLARVPEEIQKRLVNWGYIICDAGLRTHYPNGRLGAATQLPYPEEPLS